MKTPTRAFVVGVAVAAISLSLALPGSRAQADEEPPAALFRSATDALAGDRPNDAIARFEGLGDHGIVDPVVSYDRGLAYAARVRAGAAHPGDLGRAAHGFEEAAELSTDPLLVADATRALHAVRAEIARQRARAGDTTEVEHGVSLGRSVVKLLGEDTWAILAALFSVTLTLAVIGAARARARRTRVAFTTTAGIAGALLLASAAILHAARDARLHLREGVIVTTTRLLDERHIAADGVAPAPEGARVRILVEDGELSRVAVGRVEGWLPSSAVLPLAKR